jgi:hypothetical protein
MRVEEDRIFMEGIAEDPNPPTDDEEQDAKLPEPTEPQGDDVKTDPAPTDDDGDPS